MEPFSARDRTAHSMPQGLRDTATLLPSGAVRLGLAATDRRHAIGQVGQVFQDLGATGPEYTADMLDREASSSTYIGNGVAIPHGTYESRQHINRSALALLQFPGGIDWDGDQVTLCLGVAAVGDQQIGLLCSLAQILMDPERVLELHNAATPESIMRLFRDIQ